MFYTANIQDVEKTLQYSSRICQLPVTLKNMRADIDDNEMSEAILNSLPDRFYPFISAMVALENEDRYFSFEFFKSRLFHEDQRTDMRIKTLIVKSKTAAIVEQNDSEN